MSPWKHPQHIPNTRGFKLTVIYRDGTTHDTYIAKADNNLCYIATHAADKNYSDVMGWRDRK